MNPHTVTARRAASAAALIAIAGLTMTGCKSSTTSSSTGNSSSSGGSASASSSSSTSTGGTSAGGSSSGGSSSGGTTSSDDGAGYFPIAVGNTWVYTDSAGAGTTTSTNKMTKVVPTAGGQRVTMEISTGLAGAGNAPIKVTYVFHSDGSITVPFTQFGSGTVRLKSGSIVWPSKATLASGQPHSSTLVFDTDIAGHTARDTSLVTVQGGASQTVTVPAGTYHAQIINETFREKVDGVSVSLRLKTWVANGVGPVKSDLITKSGASSIPGTVEELKSFTKG